MGHYDLSETKMEAISLNNANGSIGKSNRLPKKDVDILLTAINKIVFTEVLEKELSNLLPITDDLSDSNKIYRGKVSIALCRYVRIHQIA